jgi:predicted alpha-1,6-mannanase (GH76 family)
LAVVGAVGYKSLSPPAAAPDPPPVKVELPVAAPIADSPATRGLLNQYAAVGINKLAGMYNAGSNRATRSWRGANALGAIIQYMQVSGSQAYLADVSATYQAHLPDPHPFINRFYDDEGWWALTWVRAFDLTGDPRYLTLAENIFGNMTRGWTGACGGGVRWSKFATYKDAISNELFLQIATALHTLTPGDKKYGRWALREWKWFRHSRMLTRSGLVVDGLNRNCTPDLHSPTWTYNQGALIGGLVNLNGITHKKYLLVTARKVAYAVIHSRKLSPGGILEEPCEALTGCGADAPTFKGIFMQNLKLLYDRVNVRSYETYLLRNAVSVWAHDRNGNQFGLDWSGPYDSSDTGRQVAAMDLFITQVTGTGAPVPGQPVPPVVSSPNPTP